MSASFEPLHLVNTYGAFGSITRENARPRYIRAQCYLYKLTTPDEHGKTGLWWNRQLVSTFYGPASLAR